MKASSFDVFARHLAATSGLALHRDQEYLLRTRLGSLLEIYTCATLDDLATQLETRQPPQLLRHITEAMATHETSFFRDAKTFHYLGENILPALIARKNAPRIWSAGCATGQEPYSIAMQLEALHAPLIEIVATDLSHDAIKRAEHGVYSHFEAQRGLAIKHLLAHFTQVGDSWRANENLRRRVRFIAANLLDDAVPEGLFDIVLCRNVLIYVGAAERKIMHQRLADAVCPGGLLILGSVEIWDGDNFTQEADLPGIYRKRS